MLDVFVPLIQGALYIRSFVFGPNQILYVNSLNESIGSEILRYNAVTGEFIDVFVPARDRDFAYDLAIGPDGNLYVR